MFSFKSIIYVVCLVACITGLSVYANDTDISPAKSKTVSNTRGINFSFSNIEVITDEKSKLIPIFKGLSHDLNYSITPCKKMVKNEKCINVKQK